MLNRILQTFLLCFAAILLITEMAWSSPFPDGVLIADHTPDHEAATPGGTAKTIAPPAPSSQPALQPDASGSDQPSLKGDRDLKQAAPQADPSVPYDPYDYDAMRAINREIYGEVKGDSQK